jgi:hypothetical protein
MRVALVVCVLAVVLAAAGSAAAACPLRPALPSPASPEPLRIGIAALAAGTEGAGQGRVKPEDPDRALAAVAGLRRPGRTLVIRLNRMFQRDGAAGIARYAALVDRYAAIGAQVELQVRYHPRLHEIGDIAAYARYVRAAVRELAARPAVIALSITNEANLIASPNTSDGIFLGATRALVRGIEAARDEADAMGRTDLALGFTYAYRLPTDEAWFRSIGRLGGPAFREAVDYVGLQAYPGLVWPPPGFGTPGRQLAQAAALLRGCLMPKAGLGRETAIWITENGYVARRGPDPAGQARRIEESVAELATRAAALGVTDYRYFNLRDNDSRGRGFFDAVGVLFDDYAEKPGYAALQRAIDRYGR